MVWIAWDPSFSRQNCHYKWHWKPLQKLPFESSDDNNMHVVLCYKADYFMLYLTITQALRHMELPLSALACLSSSSLFFGRLNPTKLSWFSMILSELISRFIKRSCWCKNFIKRLWCWWSFLIMEEGPASIFIHFKQCCQPLFLKIFIAKAKRGNTDLNILFKHN